MIGKTTLKLQEKFTTVSQIPDTKTVSIQYQIYCHYSSRMKRKYSYVSFEYFVDVKLSYLSHVY